MNPNPNGRTVPCPNCGNVLPVHAKFCNQCGSKLYPAPHIPVPEVRQPDNIFIPVSKDFDPVQIPSFQNGPDDRFPMGNDPRFQNNYQDSFPGNYQNNSPGNFHSPVPDMNASQFQNNYPGPAPIQKVPNQGTRKLKQNRSLLLLILFSGLTCGIYYLYFIYKLAQDVNIACAGDGSDDTDGLGALIGYNILTCGVYMVCWEYGLVNRLKANASRYHTAIEFSGISFLLWTYTGMLLLGIGPIIAQYNLIKSVNTICRGYNEANGLS